MTIDLAALDAANKSLQADTHTSAATRRFGSAVTTALHSIATAIPPSSSPNVPPPSPPAQTGTGLWLMMWGGKLGTCSHLSDGTYDGALAAWGDPALPTVSGEAYAYTVTKGTPGADQPGYVVFDPANITPWLTQVATLPGHVSPYIDNVLSTIPGLLAAIQLAYGAVQAQGRKLFVNAGATVAGNSGSDDGSLWAAWAAQLAPFVDRMLLENWQQVSASSYVPPLSPRSVGNLSYQHWDGWQKCPAAAGGKIVCLTYAGAIGVSNAVYGRASLLTSGAAGGFAYNTGDGNTSTGTDPYSLTWAGPALHPTVQPVPPVSATL